MRIFRTLAIGCWAAVALLIGVKLLLGGCATTETPEETPAPILGLAPCSELCTFDLCTDAPMVEDPRCLIEGSVCQCTRPIGQLCLGDTRIIQHCRLECPHGPDGNPLVTDPDCLTTPGICYCVPRCRDCSIGPICHSFP